MKIKLIIKKLEMIDKLLFEKNLTKYEIKGIRDTLFEIQKELKGGQYGIKNN